MSAKKIIRTVNVKGESTVNSDRCTMEKIRPCPRTITILGKNLCAPDTLSRQPDHIPTSDTDNEAVTLLPDELFINVIDTSLTDKLQSSSASDPLVLDALHAVTLGPGTDERRLES